MHRHIYIYTYTHTYTTNERKFIYSHAPTVKYIGRRNGSNPDLPQF